MPHEGKKKGNYYRPSGDHALHCEFVATCSIYDTNSEKLKNEWEYLAGFEWFNVNTHPPEPLFPGSIASYEVDVFRNRVGIVTSLYREHDSWIELEGNACLQTARFYKYTEKKVNI